MLLLQFLVEVLRVTVDGDSGNDEPQRGVHRVFRLLRYHASEVIEQAAEHTLRFQEERNENGVSDFFALMIDGSTRARFVDQSPPREPYFCGLHTHAIERSRRDRGRENATPRAGVRSTVASERQERRKGLIARARERANA